MPELQQSVLGLVALELLQLILSHTNKVLQSSPHDVWWTFEWLAWIQKLSEVRYDTQDVIHGFETHMLSHLA